MRRSNVLLMITSILMVILILDAKAVYLSALDGIELCLYTIIPSLFPFFVISGILNTKLTGIRFLQLEKLNRMMNIPDGAESIFLLGVLGGYPVGAKCIGDCRKNGILSKKQADNLLSFCSNCGPSFIFGICTKLFTKNGIACYLWGIQILSAILTRIVLSNGCDNNRIVLTKSTVSITHTLRNSIQTIAEVCGWVVLFKIFIQLLDRWILWLLPKQIKPAIYGLLELTNGCTELQYIQSEQLRFILCAALLSFGGCCVILQTSSVIFDCNILSYIKGKFIQSIFSIVISTLLSFAIYDSSLKHFIALTVVILFIFTSVFLIRGIRKKVVAIQ